MALQAYKYVTTAPVLVDGMTRDEACQKYRHKVMLIARRVFRKQGGDNGSVALDDLVSCGAVGLIEAFDRFDPARGLNFGAYAEYRIRGAMYDALRGEDAFTRRRRELAKRVQNAVRDLRHRLDREPEPIDVATELGVDLDEYWRIVDRVKPVSHVSLTASPTGEDDEGGLPLIERVMDATQKAPDSGLFMEQVREHLKKAIAELPDRQKQCIMMYYGKDLSQAEIAAVYGVTVSRVSQILTEARERLRKKLVQVIDPNDLDFTGPTA